jgi:voltage-gated potassium channel
MKQFIYKLLGEKSTSSKWSFIFNNIIIILITLNIITLALESVKEINKSIINILNIFEIFSILLFSSEYLLRIYISDLTHPTNNRIKSTIKYIFSFFGLIDLLAIIPFYIPITKLNLSFIRVIRLTRFIRILKINRYNNSLNLIWEIITEKKPELIITGFLSFLIILISSFLMFYVEGQAQPKIFPNIFASLWWSIATLTTVGYGDIYPITIIGKIISGIIAIIGIGVIALPTGIICSGFMEKIKSGSKLCPHCGKKI